MSGQLVLSKAEARALTDEVKSDAAALWSKLLRLYEGKARVALGYSSWWSYCAAEFDVGKSHAYRLLDAGRVVQAIEAQSPIGDSPAVTEGVARELAPLLEEGPERVADAWEEAKKEHGPAPSAKDVRDAVERIHNRESWLTACAMEIAPLIRERCGLEVKLDEIHVSVSPARRRIGAATHVTRLGVPRDVYIGADQDDPLGVAAILAHELLHVALPRAGHGPEFVQAARALGLEGSPTSTYPGTELEGLLRETTDRLGPYPHRGVPEPPDRGLVGLYDWQLRRVRQHTELGVFFASGEDRRWTAFREYDITAEPHATRTVHTHGSIDERFESEAELREYLEEQIEGAIESDPQVDPLAAEGWSEGES